MDHILAERVESYFEHSFGKQALLVWSPGRINIIGEHTDYNLGYVLPAAIDRGIVMALGKSESGDGKWIAADMGEEFIPDRFASESPGGKGWSVYLLGIVSELREKGIYPGPVDVVFSGNIPQGAGLSSSAALENAFIFGLNELFQLGLSPMEMVRISHSAEQNFAGVQCGIMDQYAGMFGESGKAIFLDCQSLEAQKISVDVEGYQWILLDTGVKHRLAESAYNERRGTCEAVAARFGVSSLRALSIALLEQKRADIPEADYQKVLFVMQENNRVLQAVDAMKTGDIKNLGKLMFESHKGLKEQYGVSCEELDFLVDLARDSKEVLGARMMGGGFGGCTLNLVQEDLGKSWIENIQKAYHMHFNRNVIPFSVRMANGCTRLGNEL